MRYRTMGSSGLKVSEIGFGTAATSGLMTKGEIDDQRRIVIRALSSVSTTPTRRPTTAPASPRRIWAT